MGCLRKAAIAKPAFSAGQTTFETDETGCRPSCLALPELYLLELIFAKHSFPRALPLTFLKFLTNRSVCDFMPLGAFRNSSISKRRAIRLFHEEGYIRANDIKYLTSNGALVTLSPGHT